MGHFYQFLLSIGVKGDIFNWMDEHFVLVCNLESDLESFRIEILTRFKGDIDRFGQHNAKDVLPHVQQIYIQQTNQKKDL
jgi:hypothetical protein